MRKIPTLFERKFLHGNVVSVSDKVMPGFEWVMQGHGVATEKVDGACCAIIDGVLYKRFDAKPLRTIPPGAIACQPEPDRLTGHWPHWVRVDPKKASDKWFVSALYNTPWAVQDGTYEAVGPHFQKNPYGLDEDFLESHGRIVLHDIPRDFEGIKEYLRTHEIEGVVFWMGGNPKCKIKRSDFGFEWPIKERGE